MAPSAVAVERRPARLGEGLTGSDMKGPASGMEDGVGNGEDGEMAMIASLPMYDFPDLATHTDALWTQWSRLLREAGVDAPAALTRPQTDLLGHWRNDNLVVSQACGYPYRAWLHDRLALVGTFAYRDVAPKGRYRCVVISRAGDGRPLTEFECPSIAANGSDSLTGWVCLGAALADAGIGRVGAITITGAHSRSVIAVASGTSDLAAIDAVTFSLLQRYRPYLTAAVRVIGFGPEVPGPPIVTAHPALAKALRETASEALRTCAATSLAALGIEAFVECSPEAYDPVIDLAERAGLVLSVPDSRSPQSALALP